MLLIYKNKGILVVPYFVGSFIGCAIALNILKRKFGGIFAQIDFYNTAGFAFLVCAIVTYLTRNDYYLNKNGEKQKMDTPNEFYFLKMEIWAYIFFALALVFFGNFYFHYFGVSDF